MARYSSTPPRLSLLRSAAIAYCYSIGRIGHDCYYHLAKAVLQRKNNLLHQHPVWRLCLYHLDARRFALRKYMWLSGGFLAVAQAPHGFVFARNGSRSSAYRRELTSHPGGLHDMAGFFDEQAVGYAGVFARTFPFQD